MRKSALVDRIDVVANHLELALRRIAALEHPQPVPIPFVWTWKEPRITLAPPDVPVAINEAPVSYALPAAVDAVRRNHEWSGIGVSSAILRGARR